MSFAEMFVNLGLPSGFVAMVLIALIFRKAHPTTGKWAARLAILLGMSLAGFEFWEIFLGTDADLKLMPQNVRAFTYSGRPTDLDISIVRKSKSVKTIKIEKVSETVFQSRSLAVKSDVASFRVEHQGYQIGILNHRHLRDVGWLPSEECPNVKTSKAGHWYTNRVHVGQSSRLGMTPYGVLTIRATKFTADGDAVVSLSLLGHSDPIPNELKIRNKAVDVQSFPGLPVFYIAVREANFQTGNPWVAFTVFLK